MEGSQFSIKIHGVSFGNSMMDNSNWDKTSESIIKKSISGTNWTSLRGKKIIVSQIVLYKLWNRSNIYSSKIYHEGNWKNTWFTMERKKRPRRHLAQLSIWRGVLAGPYKPGSWEAAAPHSPPQIFATLHFSWIENNSVKLKK